MTSSIMTSSDIFGIAHQEAWEKSQVLHRDISLGNILIDVESTLKRPRGLLADWELCKYRHELSKDPTPPGRQLVSQQGSLRGASFSHGCPGYLAFPFGPTSAIPAETQLALGRSGIVCLRSPAVCTSIP